MRVVSRLGFVLLLLLGSLGLANVARAEYLVEEAGLRFPDKLGSAMQTRSVRYPQAHLGHGIDYRGQNFGASIFVYTGGASDIPNGTASPVVRAQFAKARSDIFAVQKQNNQPEPKLIAERPIQSDGVEFLAATYRLVRGNTEAVSLVALTGFRGQFVKVRISAVVVNGEANTAQMDEFIQAVARLLTEAR